MSNHHANVALSPGQINKLNSKQASASGTSLTLKHGLSGGQNKLSVTQTQLNQIYNARSTGKRVKLDFTAPAVRDMVKSGGIFLFLEAISALIVAATPAVAKAAALGAVGTAAGMALKKVTGKGYKQGENISQIAPVLAGPLMIASRIDRKIVTDADLDLVHKRLGINPVEMMVKRMISKSGSGYKKKGKGLRLPGTPAS